MDFNNVIGQQNIVNALKNILCMGNVAHAYIFSGPEGTGKFTVANIFANALLCQGVGEVPCGRCKSCKMFVTQNHPDVEIITTKKASLGIDIIRDMQEAIHIKPFFKGKKVYIIKDADKMTVQAQNCLLKTLEEPPSSVVLILLTENFHAFLPTIISRCQNFKFSRIPSERVRDFLTKRLNMAPEKAKIYAELSQGSIGKALKMAESDDFKEMRGQLIDTISKILEYDKMTSLNCVDFFIQNKENRDEIFKNFIIWMRDILILKQTGDEQLVINLDKVDNIEKQVNRFTTSQIKYIIDIVQQTTELLNSNVNYQLAVENMILDIQGVRADGNSCRRQI
ncbi:MAG: DNA polymerase III subunit delta' [Clostridia bacterium]|nr:DNA polymerase III subunit delta' [Clostridia bacterium]